MKNNFNCRVDEKGNITIKLVKMGMDIDEENNHRIRGIIPTDDGKYLFIELSDGNRLDKSYFDYLTKKEYLEKYPYEKYLYCMSCFRVDIPKDYYDNYSKEYLEYDRKSFYNINYDKENIVEFLKIFNKNITDIELINNNYVDEFCESNGFYRLYDDRLEHLLTPITIIDKTNSNIEFDMLYKCTNYNHTENYEERLRKRFNNYNLDDLYEKYGKKLINQLIAEYDSKLESLRQRLDNENELNY